MTTTETPTQAGGFDPPAYTQVPNQLFDMMIGMSEAELKVTLFIVRKTFGFHQDQDQISYSQLEAGTGLSRPGVSAGIKAGMKRGSIKREKKGNSYLYSLAVKEVNQDEQLKELTENGKKSLPKIVNEVNTQKKLIKETLNKKDSPASADAPPTPPVKNHEHPAVQTYREVVRRYPPKAWYIKVARIVGESDPNLDRWKQLVTDWLGYGWNPGNVKGMLEAYERGGIDGPNGSGAKPTPKRNGVHPDLRLPTEEQKEEQRRAIARSRKKHETFEKKLREDLPDADEYTLHMERIKRKAAEAQAWEPDHA